jgi:hypothetical protein
MFVRAEVEEGVSLLRLAFVELRRVALEDFLLKEAVRVDVRTVEGVANLIPDHADRAEYEHLWQPRPGRRLSGN